MLYYAHTSEKSLHVVIYHSDRCVRWAVKCFFPADNVRLVVGVMLNYVDSDGIDCIGLLMMLVHATWSMGSFSHCSRCHRPYVVSLLDQCWASVVDAGPTLIQMPCISVKCRLDVMAVS